MSCNTSAVLRGAFCSISAAVTGVTSTEASSRVRLEVEPVTTMVSRLVSWPAAAAEAPWASVGGCVSAAGGGASAPKAGRSAIVGAAVTDSAAKILRRNLSLLVVFMHTPGALLKLLRQCKFRAAEKLID